MNKALGIAIIAAFAGSVVAEVNQSESTDKQSGKHGEFLRQLRERRAKKLAENGGLVISRPTGKIVEIVNHQQAIPEDWIREAVLRIQKMSGLPIEIVKDKTSAAGTWVELVYNETDPSILSAVDDGWAKSNFWKLKKDDPPEATVKARLMKWMWRSIGASFGLGVSSFQPSILRNFMTIQELDAIPMMQPEPPSMNCFNDVSQYYGIAKIKFASYRKACTEGWAPPPTNDIQKSVWDKVHTLPANPMKIEFDPKKGR